MSETIIKKLVNRKIAGIEEKLPIKIVQFGEGNFLRAFVDYAIHVLNKEVAFNAGVAVVQPIDKGLVSMLNDQDGLYTLFMKGVKNKVEIQDKELVTSVVKGVDPFKNFSNYLDIAKEEELQFVISNTTEAGITYLDTDTRDMMPPASFPAKLTVLLHERFNHFDGDSSKGLVIIPCELINYNADTLRTIILKYIDTWELGADFKAWVLADCSFHNTLVDRIVPGYPRNEIEAYNAQLDYQDNLIVTAEAFFLWVIEGGEDLKKKLPFDRTDLDVKIVRNMQPYRTRKVRILNGAHTSMVPFSLMYGNTTVKETVDHPFTGDFVNKAIFEEINPTLDMDRNELDLFATDVLDRFKNPFIFHKLADIALNSISKFKVRVLPSLLAYVEIKGELPKRLTFAFACLIRFYKGAWKGGQLPIKDGEDIVAKIQGIWSEGDFTHVAQTILSDNGFWGKDLTEVEGLLPAIAAALEEIEKGDIEKAFVSFSSKF